MKDLVLKIGLWTPFYCCLFDMTLGKAFANLEVLSIHPEYLWTPQYSSVPGDIIIGVAAFGLSAFLFAKTILKALEESNRQ